MPISDSMKKSLSGSSMIRKMFEEGLELKKKYGNDNVFDFSIGNPDLEPPAEFHKAFTELAQQDAKGSHSYMPNAGYPEAREAMAKKVNREHKVSIGLENVVMTVGAAGALNITLKAILNPGDEVIVTKPYFLEYNGYVANHGGVLKAVPAKPDFNIDVAAIEAALSPKTAAVIINSPNNPSGRLYPESTIIALGEALRRWKQKNGRGVYLIADEPYRDIVYGGKVTPPVLCHYEDSIVVNSYSKSLSLPGERIGYAAVGPLCENAAEMMGALVIANRVLGFVNAPALMQKAVTALVDVKMDMSPYERRRDMIANGLRSAGYEFLEPEGAFYLFVKSPSPDEASFTDYLKTYNILTVPATSFGAPGWIRLSYAVPDSTIKNSIPKFAEALRAWREKK
jgi:aspartate aminotransferase